MKTIALLLTLITVTAFADTGMLFIAHGSMKGHGEHKAMECAGPHHSEWEHYVHSTLEDVKTDVPYKFELAFGMWETKCFDEAIVKLQAQMQNDGKELDHLIVFPMFISSYSEVIEMQKFIFRKRDSRPMPLFWVKPSKFTGKVTFMNSFDYTPELSAVLEKRFISLVKRAGDNGFSNDKLELILVMHGPVGNKLNEKWMEMGEAYVKDINARFPLAATHVISLRDDALPHVRNRATKELRGHIQNATAQGRISLVLPLLVSRGGIEEGILKRIEGLKYIWTGEVLLPDAGFKSVILNKMKRELPQ